MYLKFKCFTAHKRFNIKIGSNFYSQIMLRKKGKKQGYYNIFFDMISMIKPKVLRIQD